MLENVKNLLSDGVTALGGILIVRSRPGEGTDVAIRIPVPGPAAERGPDD